MPRSHRSVTAEFVVEDPVERGNQEPHSAGFLLRVALYSGSLRYGKSSPAQ